VPGSGRRGQLGLCRTQPRPRRSVVGRARRPQLVEADAPEEEVYHHRHHRHVRTGRRRALERWRARQACNVTGRSRPDLRQAQARGHAHPPQQVPTVPATCDISSVPAHGLCAASPGRCRCSTQAQASGGGSCVAAKRRCNGNTKHAPRQQKPSAHRTLLWRDDRNGLGLERVGGKLATLKTSQEDTMVGPAIRQHLRTIALTQAGALSTTEHSRMRETPLIFTLVTLFYPQFSANAEGMANSCSSRILDSSYFGFEPQN